MAGKLVALGGGGPKGGVITGGVTPGALPSTPGFAAGTEDVGLGSLASCSSIALANVLGLLGSHMIPGIEEGTQRR